MKNFEKKNLLLHAFLVFLYLNKFFVVQSFEIINSIDKIFINFYITYYLKGLFFLIFFWAVLLKIRIGWQWRMRRNNQYV